MMAVATAMEMNTRVRPSLQGRKSLSSRRLARYESMPSNDAIKTLKTSNSERLLQLKNRLSLGNSYQKIDPTSESVNKNWDTETSSSSHQSGSGSGLRRRRSFNDKVHAMYKHAGIAIRKGAEDDGIAGSQSEDFRLHQEKASNHTSFVPHALSSPTIGASSASSSRSSEKSSSDLLSRAANVTGRKQRAAKRHSDPTGDLSASRTAGTNRRRSRRQIQNETVTHHSNDGLDDEGKRREMFQKDFPGEPIPSDAILMRLYGNMPLPPPLPPATPHSNAFDEQASVSNRSCESAPASPSASRSSKNMLKSPLVSPAFSESSKSKASPSSSRRTLSKSKLLETGDRSHLRSESQHSRGRKSRRSSKSRDLTSDPKGSKSKRKEYSTPKSRSRKSVETMKIRNKNSPNNSPSEGSRNSDYEAFQALLDLSNGSFFDDDELNNSESMNFMRTSLTSINSAPYGEETGDKDRKKKRKGKRDGKIRSRSADQNRDTSTKSRKGKRSSKSKTSTDHDRKSLHSTWYDQSGNLLMDSSLRGEQSERAGKTNKSPKVVARKKSTKEDGLRPRRNSKSAGSPGNLSTRKKNKKGTSEQGLKSPNRDDSAKTNGVTAKEIIETARDILASPKLMGNELSGKSRWNAQPSPAQNAILPRGEDSSVARDSHFDDSVSPQPEATTPPGSPGNLSTRKKNKKGTSEQGLKSPNRDDSAKTNGVTAKEIIETARDILASPKLMGNELSGKSRWNAQPSPAQNAILPRGEDSSVARDSHFDDSVSPQPEATTPPSSQRQIDFHLEFLEYQNVSPLTVASKKMSPDIIAAIGFLES